MAMEGSLLGITNCHLYLLPDGTIKIPSSYENVFTLEKGYHQRSPDGCFEAVMAAGVKIGGSAEKVPLIVRLKGKCVRKGLIEGEFEAEPQGEVYSFYRQSGKFRMDLMP